MRSSTSLISNVHNLTTVVERRYVDGSAPLRRAASSGTTARGVSYFTTLHGPHWADATHTERAHTAHTRRKPHPEAQEGQIGDTLRAAGRVARPSMTSARHSKYPRSRSGGRRRARTCRGPFLCGVTLKCHPVWPVSPCFVLTHAKLVACRSEIRVTIASRTANGCAGSARRLVLRALCHPRRGRRSRGS